MLLNTTYAIDMRHYEDSHAKTYALREAKYRHMQALMEHIDIESDSKKRIQTFKAEWNSDRHASYGFFETAVVQFTTWVTWLSPTDCPIGDEVEHSDFERAIGYTAQREHSYVVVPIFENPPLSALRDPGPISREPYKEKILWFNRMRARTNGTELRCWRRVQ